MQHRGRLSFLVALLALTTVPLSRARNNPAIMTPQERKHALLQFIAKKKFVEERFYPGATNEADRLRFEAKINDLARVLSELPPANQTKATVLAMFQPAMTEFEDADSQERDRFLSYLEELMDIFGIESSDGLLNKWRYGFDPTESIETANAKAIAVMTPDERDLLARLKDVSAADALVVLTSVLGPPSAEATVARIWYLKPDASSAIGLSSQAGATVLTWIAKNRFSYSRRL